MLVASSQRLIRRICPNCKEKLKVTDYAKAKKGGIPSELIEGVEYYEGRGCPNCNYTGYRGRLAVFEVLPVNMQIREAIFKKATLNALKRVSWEIGMRTIRESGIEQMKAGLTTLDEVLRETLHDKPLAEYMKKGIKFA